MQEGATVAVSVHVILPSMAGSGRVLPVTVPVALVTAMMWLLTYQ